MTKAVIQVWWSSNGCGHHLRTVDLTSPFNLTFHMAATRFAYVRNYEQPDPILPNAYFVVRVDGQSFHK